MSKEYFFYPRTLVGDQLDREPVWQEVSGRATLASYIINYRPLPQFETDEPQIIALVDLEEGPRLMTNLVDVAPDPAALVLDMPLEVVFVPRGDQHLPFFRPTQKEQS